MANVFRKLISKELGEINYHRYSSYIKHNMDNKNSNRKIIFNDMYEKLAVRDIKSIAKMHERLNDTMILAFRISKNYFFSFLIYLAASIFIIAKGIQPELMILALFLMSMCFVYKTYEFIANKFCYIDAQIVLVYKTVLDQIILNEHLRAKGKKNNE